MASGAHLSLMLSVSLSLSLSSSVELLKRVTPLTRIYNWCWNIPHQVWWGHLAYHLGEHYHASHYHLTQAFNIHLLGVCK